MKVFSVSLNAGVQVSVRGGNFFMLIDTTAPLDVTLVHGGAEIEKAESVEAGFKAHARFADLREDGGRYFDEARLLSATAQTVRVGISDGAGGYDRALGEVTSEPKLTQSAASPVGMDAITNNGFAFYGVMSLGAVAGEYANLQILNPAASGKVIYLDRIVVATSGAVTIDAGQYNTALAVEAGTPVNAKVGGAASAMSLLRQSVVAELVYAGAQYVQVPIAANAPYEILLPRPILLSAGQGVVIRSRSPATTIYGNMEWREYA